MSINRRASSSFRNLSPLKFRKRLLASFRRDRRDLPWRHTRDPYRIWVSEIMLQQTQIATVLRYYRIFLKRFPTVYHLAAASERKVLAAWAGLGYYRRARNMRRAAKLVVQNYHGKLPDNYDDLRALPGIGRYTAGAILSIAFGKPYPAVDGNVERVLSRVLVLRGNLKTFAHQKVLWSTAEALVPTGSPGDFNQALMELGATVCLPRNPQCGRCPVESLCGARKQRRELTLPAPQRSPRVQTIWRCALVIRDSKNRVLLIQRRDETLMENFWEFPHFDAPRPISQAQFTHRVHRHLHSRFHFTVEAPRWICAFRHTITFRRIQVNAYLADLNGSLSESKPSQAVSRWVPDSALKEFLFDTASMRILTAYRACR